MSRSTLRAVHGPRAFSLIEILVSILILALGLLGLGALFPAVIREQRAAGDAVQGVIAANNIAAFIEGRLGAESKTRYAYVEDSSGSVTVLVEQSGWAGLLTADVDAAPSQAFSNGVRQGLWSPRFDTDSGQLARFVLSPRADAFTAGAIEFDTVGVQPLPTTAIPPELRPPTGTPVTVEMQTFPPAALFVGDRLDPISGGFADSPQFVWDMVPRRVAEREDPETQATLEPWSDGLQMAVFVRRVDPGIRRVPGYTLRQTLLGVNGAGATVVPVGAVPLAAADDERGLATLDGTSGPGGGAELSYSWPMEAFAPGARVGGGATPVFYFYDDAPTPPTDDSEQSRQWLERVDVTRAVGRAMAQVGQKLIDNLGNVYTVERIEEYEGTAADPDLRRLRLSPAPALEDIRDRGGPAGRRIKQFICTPQVPAAVKVVDIPRTVKVVKP
jgi:prepilin-type N-terminal cleavage/methylation domain-containing protein